VNGITDEITSIGKLQLKDRESTMDRDATVYVVDDDEAARESVLALVGQKGVRAKGFASAEAFLAALDPAAKGCLVVDVRMHGMTGLQLIEQLAQRHSPLPVVVITGYADVPMAVRAMQMGAVTFLEKPCHDQELWGAIQQALEIEQQRQFERAQQSDIAARIASLTEEEATIFRMLLAGKVNKRIAIELDLGLRTVELRRSTIMRKMQAASLPDLVRLAILGGFLKPEEAPQLDAELPSIVLPGDGQVE
jgi:FixJ family two-component response regulator